MDHTLFTSNADAAYRKHSKEHNEAFVTLRSKKTSKNSNVDKLQPPTKEAERSVGPSRELHLQCVRKHTGTREGGKQLAKWRSK